VSANNRDILRRVRFFADLADNDCDAVLRVLKARRGPPGTTLFNEGDPGSSLMIVLEGELTASVKTGKKESEVVARLGPGEIVGEMAFLDAEARSATVSTEKGATVLEFTRAALAQIAREAPSAAATILRNVLSDLAKRLRDVGEKMTERVSMMPHAPSRPSIDGVRSGRGLTADQLRSIPALKSYTHEDLELLAYIAFLRGFPADTEILEEGTPGDSCYLIVSGNVEVWRKGHHEALATLGPGALVGQLALLSSAPRSASVMTVGEVRALEVRADAFANLVRAHSPMAIRFQEQVALAGARQLRIALRKFADVKSRAAFVPTSSMRALDDWDDGDAGPALELAVDPSRLRR
jgi:CRP/FNR family cyclic AMP-dependent transcriptional regulator